MRGGADEEDESARDGTEDPVPATGFRRGLLVASGWTALALGIAGAFLPVLPTTPFVLLAAACFARSSPELHRRLLENRRLGPYLRQWRRDRSVPRRAKQRAYVLVVLTFAFSMWAVESDGLRVMLGVLGSGLLIFLWLLRTAEIDEVAEDDRS